MRCSRFSEALGQIADHAVFAALQSEIPRAEVRLVSDHLNVREYVTVRVKCVDLERVDGTVCGIWEVWLAGRWSARSARVSSTYCAARACAAVDARLNGADWSGAVIAATNAATEAC